jgi:hypothetical protein
MRKHEYLIFAVLGLAACARPDPPAPPQAEAGSSEEASEQETEATAAVNSDDRLEVASLADGPSAWTPCPPGLVETVRSYPLLVEGVETTLGDRVDGGAVSAVIERLDPAFVEGTWMCQADGGILHFEYQALMHDQEFGPRWFTPSSDQLAPLNLLAEAVNGTWQPVAGDEDRVRNILMECQFEFGSLTSGAFLRILNDAERAPDATDARWTVIPHERREGAVTYRAILDWPSADGRKQATWIVSPGAPECEPADDEARAIVELAIGMPQHNVTLASGGPTPSNRPFAEPSERGRSLAYAFAEERELATIADWLEFHSRLDPYQTREWEVEGRPAPDGTRRVSLSVGRDEGVVQLAYRVNPATGEIFTDSVHTSLARAVMPRRAPGVGTIAHLPSVLEEGLVDETLAANVSGLAGCIRASGAGAVRFEWSIAWDGHAYGVEAIPDENGLGECMTEFFAGVEFPRFAGAPMQSTSEISLVQ